MHYLVTGASGFLGGTVARQLRAAGHEVTSLIRGETVARLTPAKAQALQTLDIHWLTGDITDRAAVRMAMRGVDGVFHLAAWYKLGAKEDAEAERINVEGTRVVLGAMRELNIPRGVYTSTVGVFSDTEDRLPTESDRYDGPHWCVYNRTKWRAHYEVALPLIEQGLPLIIVMPAVIYGPGDASAVQQTFQRLQARKLPAIPAETAYSWGFVDDIARGHLLAMERGRPGEAYILAGPRHTIVEALTIAAELAGVPLPRRRLSRRFLRRLARLSSLMGRVLPLPHDLHPEVLRAASANFVADSSKARRELGFTARPLAEGLRETLQTP
jgi:dihydroflavonol-4-reductase